MASPSKLSREEMRNARLRSMGIEITDEEKAKKGTAQSLNSQAIPIVNENTAADWVIDDKMATNLRNIIANSSLPKDDLNRWYLQGFTICSSISYGLRQVHGGPCGILASVQAELLREVLFHNNVSKGLRDIPVISKDDFNVYLTMALTKILFRASASGNVHIVVANSILHTSDSYKGLLVKTFSSEETLQLFLKNNIFMFEFPSGCILFLLSLILTRQVDVIKTDMDDSTNSLLAQYGHCTQELVNLLLTGRATSNVFNGHISTGGSSSGSGSGGSGGMSSSSSSSHVVTTTDNNDNNNGVGGGGEGYNCKGVLQRNSIGYLSHLEAMRYVQVGSYYKIPLVPIWVIGSASHFTVLFSTSTQVNENTFAEDLLERFRMAFKAMDSDEAGFIPAEKLNPLLESVDALKYVTDIPNYKRLAQNLQLETTSTYSSGRGGGSGGVETGVTVSGIVLWSLFWEHVSVLSVQGQGQGYDIDKGESQTTQTQSWGYQQQGQAQGLHSASKSSSSSSSRFRSDSDIARELQAQWDAELNDSAATAINSVSGSGYYDMTTTTATNPIPPSSRTAISRHDSIADESAEGFRMFHLNGLEDHSRRQARLCPFTLYRRAARNNIGKANVPLDDGTFPGNSGSNPLEEVLRTRWQGCRIDWLGQPPPSID
eukprot:gene8984-18593_t